MPEKYANSKLMQACQIIDNSIEEFKPYLYLW